MSKLVLLVALLSFVSVSASADAECEARATVDEFEGDVCDSSSCDATIELTIQVNACTVSKGEVEVEVDVDGESERDERIVFSWALADDEDTTLEKTVKIFRGEWIDAVDVDSVECTCTAPKEEKEDD